MTNNEVETALGVLVYTVRQADIEKVAWAIRAFATGQYDQAHDAVNDIIWGCHLSGVPYPDGLLALAVELATRRRPTRPADFVPPSRYGHLRG